MYEAVLNVPALNLVLRLQQLGAENYNVRCCFKNDSEKPKELATPRKKTSPKRQPLIEKNENSKQPVKPAQQENLQEIDLRYQLRTLPQVEVLGLVGDNLKVLAGLAKVQSKEEHRVFCIGDKPFGLELDGGKTEKNVPDKGMFLCFQCGKILRRITSMLAHTYSHIGVKQFACTLCDKAYSYKGGLSRHCKKQHSLDVTPTTPKKPKLQNSIAQLFTCPICQEGYEIKNSFYRHRRIKHKNSGRLQPIITRKDGTSPESVPQIVEEVPMPVDTTCSICFNTYSSKKTLKMHFNKIHSNIHNFLCPYCFKGFYYKTNYDSHMKKEFKSHRIQNTNKENIPPFEEFLRYIND